MEDKKTNTPAGANQPDTGTNKPETGSIKPVSIDLLAGKSKEDIKKEAINQTAEFGSAGMDDINKNVGSFGNTVVKPVEVNQNEVKLDVDAKVVEKASQEKINFERFQKTKKTEKAAKTKFGEKVSIMLRSKKGLRTTWIIEMLVMVITVAAAIVLACLFAKWWGYNNKEIGGPMLYVQDTLKVGYVFVWIAMFPCAVPLIYLITTWFIGINQVASSRLYHYIFWGFAGFGLICLIIGFGLLCPALVAWVSFPAYW